MYFRIASKRTKNKFLKTVNVMKTWLIVIIKLCLCAFIDCCIKVYKSKTGLARIKCNVSRYTISVTQKTEIKTDKNVNENGGVGGRKVGRWVSL